MPNSVIIGRLRAVEPGHIILGGHMRIQIPTGMSVAQFPIGCSLTVVAHQESDDHIVAESITLNEENR
jgi:hypothetical protein